MGKFTWVLEDPSSLGSSICHSGIFKEGDFAWHLAVYLLANNLEYLALNLKISNGPSLPSGWRRYVKYRLTMVNQLFQEISLLGEGMHCFDLRVCMWVSVSVIPLPKFCDKDGGFLLNDELKIVAEVDVFETTEPLTDDGVLLEEASVDVNGFQVLPSQVESVKCIFERHPDIASEFRSKNQLMRKTCMNVLINLIETLCQPLEELSNEDLVEADIALTFVKDLGFKVDWLEKKLDQVKEKKKKELSGLAMLQETEENLLKLKLKCSELDAFAEEQKAELSATRTPLSFDDVV